MGEISESYRRQHEHERDDFLDELARYDEAMLKGDREKASIQLERMKSHLQRMEEIGRLSTLLNDY